MKSFSPYFCLILTGGLLMAGVMLLYTGRLEYCGRAEVLNPHVNVQTVANAPAPTLAPPRKVVFVQVEADKSDLEVTWLND
jgi:hypothetical protein